MSDFINYWNLGNTLDLGKYPKNQEMQFSLSDLDSEDRFNKNASEFVQGYSANSFTYKYNSCGFRSQEFNLADTSPVILTLGCSHTVGVGIPQTASWPEQLGDTYFPNHIVYNAGLGGASADTVARLAINMIPIIKPDIVAIMWPSLHRFETYEDGPVSNGAWNIKQDQLLLEDNTAYNNQTKNKAILELLQKIYNFKLLAVNYDTTVDIYTVTWTKARDSSHFGPDWHGQMAFDFNLQYNNYDDFTLKYTNPKEYYKKYKDKAIK